MKEINDILWTAVTATVGALVVWVFQFFKSTIKKVDGIKSLEAKIDKELALINSKLTELENDIKEFKNEINK